MHAQTKPHAAFSESLQASLGQLIDRATAAGPGAERSRLLRWLLVALAMLVLWRFGRGLKRLSWAMFGIAMASWWSDGALGWLLR